MAVFSFAASKPLRQRFTLSLSVFVIVRDADRILLLRRANTGWKDGLHSLPAGAHDGNEPLAVAAARELREETGLVANPDDLRLVHLLHCAPTDGNGEWLGAFFLAEAWTGTPALAEPDKHDHIGWHGLAALPDTLIDYTRQGIELGLRGIPNSHDGWTRDS